MFVTSWTAGAGIPKWIRVTLAPRCLFKSLPSRGRRHHLQVAIIGTAFVVVAGGSCVKPRLTIGSGEARANRFPWVTAVVRLHASIRGGG